MEIERKEELKKILIVTPNEFIGKRFFALISNIQSSSKVLIFSSFKEATDKAAHIGVQYYFLDIDYALEKERKYFKQIVKYGNKNKSSIIGITHFSSHFFPYSYFQPPLSGYIKKKVSLIELVEVFRATRDGGKYLDNNLNVVLINYISGNVSRGKLDVLSESELLVLQEVLEGSCAPEIASILSRSPSDVENIILSIYKKLGLIQGDLTGLFRIISQEKKVASIQVI